VSTELAAVDVEPHDQKVMSLQGEMDARELDMLLSCENVRLSSIYPWSVWLKPVGSICAGIYEGHIGMMHLALPRLRTEFELRCICSSVFLVCLVEHGKRWCRHSYLRS
jgi:hypothetical protein